MTITYCDRCKTEVDQSGATVRIDIDKYYSSAAPEPNEEKDLCEACTQVLQVLLSNFWESK